MFGFRPDGKKVKVTPVETLVPFIMNRRTDATNYTMEHVNCEQMDAWIKKQKEEKGISFSYMDIIFASVVRLYSMRPVLNRFSKGNRVYQRYGMYICLTIKSSLDENAKDVNLKMRFMGNENVYQVKEIIEREVKKGMEEVKDNKTEKAASILSHIPNFLLAAGVGIIKFCDYLGLLGNKILAASPFHTSIYITNLKSIKGDAIFHHIYNFGTTGLFVSIGKEKQIAVVDENDNIVKQKVLDLGISLDERFIDGFYAVKTFRLWKEMLETPSVLEESYESGVLFEYPKERRKRLKAIRLEEKQAIKGGKKTVKKVKKETKKKIKTVRSSAKKDYKHNKKIQKKKNKSTK